MQVENRVTGGKPIRGDHGLQILDVILIERTKFQDNLLGTGMQTLKLSKI
jgi:hypothetical protein